MPKHQIGLTNALQPHKKADAAWLMNWQQCVKEHSCCECPNS